MGKLFPVCGNSKNAADGSGYPHIVGLKAPFRTAFQGKRSVFNGNLILGWYPVFKHRKGTCADFYATPVFRTIRCRSLVLQSVNDDVVDPKSAEYIFENLQGEKEMDKISPGDHVVLLSAGSEQACSCVRKFLLNF